MGRGVGHSVRGIAWRGVASGLEGLDDDSSHACSDWNRGYRRRRHILHAQRIVRHGWVQESYLRTGHPWLPLGLLLHHISRRQSGSVPLS